MRKNKVCDGRSKWLCQGFSYLTSTRSLDADVEQQRQQDCQSKDGDEEEANHDRCAVVLQPRPPQMHLLILASSSLLPCLLGPWLILLPGLLLYGMMFLVLKQDMIRHKGVMRIRVRLPSHQVMAYRYDSGGLRVDEVMDNPKVPYL